MTRWTGWRRGGRPAREGDTIREAMVRFAVGIALTLLVLAVCSISIGRGIARSAELTEAEERTQALADNVAAPMVTRRYRSGHADAIADLDRVMRRQMLDPTIRHVKLWSASGRVLWSDETPLIGRRFTLNEEERDALHSGTAVAEVSDLAKPENAIDRQTAGSYVEVYAGTTGADGERLLFEVYLATDRIGDRELTSVKATILVALASLLVFAAVVLPMSLRLARRVQSVNADRARMTRRALLGAEYERRRIAQDLHDGVIQDLAGVGYAMPAVVQRVREGRADPAADGEALERINRVLTRNVAALRRVMADVFPPDLAGDGLRRAVEDLVLDAAKDLHVTIGIDHQLVLPEEAEHLAYRVVREGVRNVVKHAHATRMQVDVHWDAPETQSRERGWVHVVVADDGVGGAVDDQGEPRFREGHLGLRLLIASVADAGGRLRVVPNTPTGTRLEASFPEDGS